MKQIKKYKFLNYTILKEIKKPDSKVIKIFNIPILKTKYKPTKGIKKYYILGICYLKKNFSVKETKHLSLVEFCDKDIPEIIEFQKFDNPLVSIVIPVYNQFDYTLRCLYSILKHAKDIPYEVIIADDCSTDETQNIEDKVKNIIVSRNTTNLGFIKNCNNGAKLAKGKYLYFLNNDTQVQPNWLNELLLIYDMYDDVGAVGSKLVSANGALQEFGSHRFIDVLYQYTPVFDIFSRKYNYVSKADYVSGCSLLTPKSIFDEIGGFDEYYAPAYSDDPDYCFKLTYNLNKKVLVNPKSLVVHYGSITYSSKKSSLQVINRQKFIKRWFDVLNNKSKFNLIKLPYTDSKRPRMILIIDDFLPQFDKHAGGKTVFQFLELFTKMGLFVKFCPACKDEVEEPYESILNRMGIEIISPADVITFINEYSELLDYVLLSRPQIAQKYLKDVLKYKNIKVLYYGHDLHYLRNKRMYDLTQSPEALKEYNIYKDLEPEIITKVDVAYYPSSIEVEKIRAEIPDVNVQVMTPYMYDITKAPRHNSYENSKGLIFVGGFNHTPNVDAVIWFVKEIYPLILDKIPDIKLYIAGSNPKPEIVNLECENIKVLGYLEQDVLEEYYKKCRVSVAPLRYGAGIKGKVVEALYNGLPVVTTSIGAEGINNSNNAITISDEPQQFADSVINLYSNAEIWAEKSQKSKDVVANNYSYEAAEKIFREIISTDMKPNILEEELLTKLM